jgi:acetyl-CoA synthetase
MLANEVPLWEVMLGACKTGAVIVPATTLLSPADLQDRLDRGGVRHVIADPASSAKFAQPSYCSTFKPAFQSVAYTSPSAVTKISAVLAASATLGRGSISFLGAGGVQ